MTAPSTDISVSIVRDVVYMAAGKGVPVSVLCAKAEIDVVRLDDADERFGLAEMNRVWAAAVELTKDNYLGLHTGEEVNFASLGIVGYLVQNSPDLMSAFKRAADYLTLSSNLLVTTIEKRRSDTVIVFTPIPAFANEYEFGARQAVESSMSFVVHAAQKLTAKPIRPKRVSFAFAAPANTAEYDRIFNTALVFREEENALLYAAEDLQLPVVSFNRTLFEMLDREAKQLVDSQSGGKTLRTEIKRLMIPMFQKELPQLESLAEKLAMSTRSLQRRLHEEGTSFQEVFEESRAELATQYLRNPSLTLSEIAYLLGYAELSAFSRAFRRRTGQSPTDFREKHLQT